METLVRACFVTVLAAACTALPFGPVEDTDDTDGSAPSDTSAFGDSGGTDEDGDTGDTTVETDDTDASPSGSDTVLSFRQYVSFWSDYVSDGAHEVLVGPDDDSSPYSGSWVVVLDAAAMEAAAADRTWTLTSVDLGPTVAAQGWTSFRVGFRYTGEGADSWYLDDVCIGTEVGPGGVASCLRVAESFDALGYGDLPDGWTSVSGPANQKSGGWIVGSDAAPSHSGPKSVERTFSSDLVDQVLVVPVP